MWYWESLKWYAMCDRLLLKSSQKMKDNDIIIIQNVYNITTDKAQPKPELCLTLELFIVCKNFFVTMNTAKELL